MKTLLILSMLLYLLFACGDQSGTQAPAGVSCGSVCKAGASPHEHPQSRQVLVAVWLGSSVMVQLVSLDEGISHFNPNNPAARVRLPGRMRASSRSEAFAFEQEH
jgi:hypothetical protein